jgi:hypothetical protein
MAVLGGFRGKCLRVDLSAGAIRSESLHESRSRKYLGGPFNHGIDETVAEFLQELFHFSQSLFLRAGLFSRSECKSSMIERPSFDIIVAVQMRFQR